MQRLHHQAAQLMRHIKSQSMLLAHIHNCNCHAILLFVVVILFLCSSKCKYVCPSQIEHVFQILMKSV